MIFLGYLVGALAFIGMLSLWASWRAWRPARRDARPRGRPEGVDHDIMNDL